jgi:hypothetical protein
MAAAGSFGRLTFQAKASIPSPSLSNLTHSNPIPSWWIAPSAIVTHLSKVIGPAAVAAVPVAAAAAATPSTIGGEEGTLDGVGVGSSLPIEILRMIADYARSRHILVTGGYGSRGRTMDRTFIMTPYLGGETNVCQWYELSRIRSHLDYDNGAVFYEDKQIRILAGLRGGEEESMFIDLNMSPFEWEWHAQRPLLTSHQRSGRRTEAAAIVIDDYQQLTINGRASSTMHMIGGADDVDRWSGRASPSHITQNSVNGYKMQKSPPFQVLRPTIVSMDNRYLFVLGGVMDQERTVNINDQLWRFDCVTCAWVQLAKLPHSASSAVLVSGVWNTNNSIDDNTTTTPTQLRRRYIYAFGTADKSKPSHIQRYDIDTNHWYVAKWSFPDGDNMNLFVCHVIDQHFILLGGVKSTTSETGRLESPTAGAWYRPIDPLSDHLTNEMPTYGWLRLQPLRDPCYDMSSVLI